MIHPGLICETCSDAPATVLVSAPMSEEIGLCQDCVAAGMPEWLPPKDENLAQFSLELLQRRIGIVSARVGA